MITYNHGEFIGQAIESILNQKTQFDFEIVIGEDCSIDSTRDIILRYKEKFPDKIKLLLHDNNIGMQKNFHETLCQCKGEYIALCEGDDYWVDNNKLQKQVSFLDENLDYSLSFHNVNIVNETTGEVKSFNKYKEDKTFSIIDVINSWFIGTQSMVFRNFDIKNEIPISYFEYMTTDRYLQILVSSKGPIKYFSEKMATYRINDTSVTVNENYGSSVAFFDSSLKMFNDFKYTLEEKYLPYLNKTINKIEEDKKIAQAITYSSNKNTIDAINILFSVFVNNPFRLFKYPRLFFGIVKNSF